MKSDLETLQGEWIVTSLKSDGKKMPGLLLGEAKIVVKNDRFTSLGMGAPYKGILSLDSTKKPKEVNLSFTSGHAKGVTHFGIYKLLGDTWTLCLATVGDKRPKSFSSKGGPGFVIETLVRDSAVEKSSQTRAASNVKSISQTAATQSKTRLEGEWQMVSAVFDGQPMDEEMVKWCKRFNRGNTTTVVAGPQVFVDATFMLDSAKSQGAINYLNRSGSNKGKEQAGIFELRGQTLRVCMSAPGKPRPESFNSSAGDGRSFTTWRLIKK